MCTVITKQMEGNPLIAKKDIKVYKIGTRYTPLEGYSKFISLYQNFIYSPEHLFQTKFIYIYDGQTSDMKESDYMDTIEEQDRVFVTRGFHSYISKTRGIGSSRTGSRTEIGLFIIPKGALYYVNGSDNVVSNQIIFKKFL